MRISDWSSDVCSSDLHGLYRILSVAQTVQAGKVVVDAQPEVTDQGGSIIRVDAKFGFSPLAFETGLPRLIDGARKAGMAALVINRCAHFRSEEHTSELQSLMRISYAVFGLKQKTR